MNLNFSWIAKAKIVQMGIFVVCVSFGIWLVMYGNNLTISMMSSKAPMTDTGINFSQTVIGDDSSDISKTVILGN